LAAEDPLPSLGPSMGDEVTGRRQVAEGFSAIRRDFRHYCRMHGASTLGQKLRLPFEAPSFLALAVYRFGRWVRAPGRSALVRLCGRAAYRVLLEASQRAARVYIMPGVEIGEEVWVSSHGPTFIAGNVGRGCTLLGANTLGRSGVDPGRPSLGEDVTLEPGAVVIGTVHVPAHTTIGANCVVSHSPASSGTYAGMPLRRVPGGREPP